MSRRRTSLTSFQGIMLSKNSDRFTSPSVLWALMPWKRWKWKIKGKREYFILSQQQMLRETSFLEPRYPELFIPNCGTKETTRSGNKIVWLKTLNSCMGVCYHVASMKVISVNSRRSIFFPGLTYQSLNPLTHKIWLFILPSCCYTLPWEWVTRIWC